MEKTAHVWESGEGLCAAVAMLRLQQCGSERLSPSTMWDKAQIVESQPIQTGRHRQCSGALGSVCEALLCSSILIRWNHSLNMVHTSGAFINLNIRGIVI